MLYGLPAGQSAAAVLRYHEIALLGPTPGGALASCDCAVRSLPLIQRRSTRLGRLSLCAHPAPASRCSISPTAVRPVATSGYGLPYPHPPELSGAFSGGFVCTHASSVEKLINVPRPANGQQPFPTSNASLTDDSYERHET
jgi:hypothetical protein